VTVPTLIRVPTINDGPQDFAKLFGIWAQVNDYFEDVAFDFSTCRFLRPNAVAFLGGLARLIESRLGTATFDWSSLHNAWVKTTMQQNGFAGTFGDPQGSWSGHSIPYREDRTPNGNDFAVHLADNWLGRGWVHLSPRLSDAIVERMLEMYMNAFEHSGSTIGLFSCGQHFYKQNRLTLAIVDFGTGIPANVRAYLKSIRPDLPAQQLRASACLQWAFEYGTTTRPNGTGRGVGLDLLRSFVRKNQGRMEVYSNEGYALITSDQECYQDMEHGFEGTLFYLDLVCDEKFYFLASEATGQ